MLRRKRGADYDLSDSDDGGEARRRMKRRQFAKMQQALFADERIKKIAENPGNQAFLRTIEDRDSGDEMDFLDIGPELMETEDSQSQDQTVPDSQPMTAAASTERQPLGSGASWNRPAAKLRRTENGKKPSNIGEIRESLSSLLEEPNTSIIPATEVGSDSEADDESRPSTARSNKENRSPGKANPRRTRHPAVVDRISLKRASSSNLSNTSRLAFAANSGSNSSFKVPALLRRATTNSLKSTSSTASGSSGANNANGNGSGGGFGEGSKIKKSAGKKSGVSYLARETERRAAITENEKRREAKKWKGAERRVQAVGGLFGAGRFE
jgi:mediator of replication checkpoint protein 1